MRGWLAARLTLYPAGYALLKWDDADAGNPLVQAAVAQLLPMLGGAAYAPSVSAVAAQLTRLAEGAAGATLAGCRILPRCGGRLLICREEVTPAPRRLKTDEELLWDRRFRVTAGRLGEALTLQSLGRPGWQELADRGVASALPGPARWALPAIRDSRGLRAVPALGWNREETEEPPVKISFSPASPLMARRFTVASHSGHII